MHLFYGTLSNNMSLSCLHRLHFMPSSPHLLAATSPRQLHTRASSCCKLIYIQLISNYWFFQIFVWMDHACRWFMPVNIMITFLAGSVLGWVIMKITRAPDHLRGLVVGCCAAGGFLVTWSSRICIYTYMSLTWTHHTSKQLLSISTQLILCLNNSDM